MHTFSLIIPIFNNEQTISDTLSSVFMQIHPFDQIICINNNSTDNSKKIILELQQAHPEIIYVEEPIPGVSSARNAGMLRATSEYVLFLDGDDLLEPDLLMKVEKQLCEHTNVDVLQYNFKQQFENGTEIVNPYILPTGEYSGEKFLYEMSRRFKYETKHMVWSLVLSRRFLEASGGYFNQNIEVFEDILFFHQYIIQAKKVVVCHDVCISYLFHPKSSTQSAKEEQLSQAILFLFNHIQPLDNWQRQYLCELAAKVLSYRSYDAICRKQNGRQACKPYAVHKIAIYLQKIKMKLMTCFGNVFENNNKTV